MMRSCSDTEGLRDQFGFGLDRLLVFLRSALNAEFARLSIFALCFKIEIN